MGQSKTNADTSEQATLERHLSRNSHSGSATEETIIRDDQVSPVVSRKSKRLSQPPERYSLGLFFMDTDEPTPYEEASTCANWSLRI